MEKEDKKIKHLEFIQANIARMNQCSFKMKGWMITVISALLALFAASMNVETGDGNSMFIYIAIAPTLLFWILDSYYLQQERKFRGIYNDIIRDLDEDRIKEFAMPLENYNRRKYCFFRVLFSKTEWPLYLLVVVGLAISGKML